MRRKKLNIMILLAITVMGVCGCSMNNTEINNTEETKVVEKQVILTERQKNILKEEGLTDNYNALLSSQQRAIVAIEEMLQYLETKYAIEFCYSGYSPESPLEKETLYAYPASGFNAIDGFTVSRVKRNGEYEYDDNYISRTVKDMYHNYIAEAVKTIAGEVSVDVYSVVTRNDFTRDPEEFSELNGKIAGTVTIFIDESTFSQDDMGKLVSELKIWLKEQELYGFFQIALLKHEHMIYLTEFNFSDYRDEYHIAVELLSVQR